MHNVANMHSCNRQYMIHIVFSNMFMAWVFPVRYPGFGCITWYGELIIADEYMRPISTDLLLIKSVGLFIFQSPCHLNNFHSNTIKKVKSWETQWYMVFIRKYFRIYFKFYSTIPNTSQFFKEIDKMRYLITIKMKDDIIYYAKY